MWICTFLGVVIIDVDLGLLIGVGVSLFTIVLRDQLLQFKFLSEYDKSHVYVDTDLVEIRVALRACWNYL